MNGIIFDLDGTLWDSTETIIKAWNNVFKKRALTLRITCKLLKTLLGNPNNEISEYLFKDLTNVDKAELMTECENEEIIMLNKSGGSLYTNLESVLKELCKTHKLYIVSNCQRGYIESFLNYHNFKKYFSDIECQGNTSLPKFENIKYIIKRNNIKLAVYVGDTIGDLKSSKLLNIPFIYAKYGFGKIEGCEHEISTIDELPKLLKEMNI